MDSPTVCAVMLSADRPEYARKAVQCFLAQTYERKSLCVFSSDPASCGIPAANLVKRATIGEMRNEANWRICHTEGFDGKPMPQMVPDIICTFDDDDYSHPNRIAEQVTLLQSSGADVVGYNEMLFWRQNGLIRRELKMETAFDEIPRYGDPIRLGEAWLYSNPNPGYTLGTSLCYWRKTWERKPFNPTSHGEDLQFCTGLKCVGKTSLIRGLMPIEYGPTTGEYMPAPINAGPRMIARIHASNTSKAYRPESMRAAEWKRVPEWDDYCRRTME